MNYVQIKKEKFDLAIKKLNAVKTQNSSLVAYDPIKTKDSFLFFFEKEHKATGAELQSLANKTEENINLVNKRIITCFDQITEVYNALVALDKEYISGIVASMEQAVDATKKAEDAQKDNSRTIQILELAVDRLNKISETVNVQLTKICGTDWQENAEDQLSIIKETNNRLDECLAKLNELDKEILNIKSQLSYQDSKINDLNDKVYRLNEKQNLTEEKCSSLEEKDDELSNELAQVNLRSVVRDEELDKRINVTNGTIRDITNKFIEDISNLDSEVKKNQEDTNLNIKKINKWLLAFTITSSVLIVGLIVVVFLLIFGVI